MKNFSSWLEEAKKKGVKDSLPPTTSSSPTRGANQDYTGVGVKHDVADYTISDEKVPDSWEDNTPGQRVATVRKLMKLQLRHGAVEMPHSKIKEEIEQVDEISTELVGKVNKARAFGDKKSKTPAAAKTLSNAVKKAWLKSNVGKIKEEAEEIDEMISGQPMTGPVQPKVSQGSGSPRTKTALQKVSDARVKAKEKADQQQDEFRAKTTQQQIAQRKQDEAKRKAANEEYIEEGRPKKNKTEEDPGSEHVIMQLRKVITTRGMHKVKHVSGETSKVEPAHAHSMLAHHDNLKTAADKQAYAARLHKSASSMKDALSGKPEHKQPKVSLAGKITGTQK
jgi:hypothetical protein